MTASRRQDDASAAVRAKAPHAADAAAQDFARTLELEQEKARLAFLNERMLIVQRAVVEYAQIGIRIVIFANGVTATAILAYLGDNAEKLPTPSLRGLAVAVAIAALGVAAGLLATLFAYLSQWNIARIEAQTRQLEAAGSRWERTAGLVCIFVGLFAFLTAIGVAATSYARYL